MIPPEMREENQQEIVKPGKKKRSRGGRVFAFVAIAFFTIAVACSAAFFTMQYGLKKGEASTLDIPTETHRVNVLVMGADIRTDDVGRSDTLMLASFDPVTGKVGVVSIPRDTRVVIPGHKGHSKINAAFAIGGPELVKRTVSEFLNVRIDYYVVLDFGGFENVVDTLGGVTIDVAKRMYYVDRAQRLIIDLKPGLQRLDGRRALGYVRFRHDAMGDIALVDPSNGGQYEGRVGRQLQFVKALAKQALRPENILKAPKLIRQVYAAIDTDIPMEKMVSLALSGRKVRPDSVQTYVLPGTGKNLGGVSYWIADERSAQEVIANMAGPGSEPEEPVHVAVLNGSGVSGVAGKAAEKLRQIGYDVVSVGNAERFNYEQTQVYAQDGDHDAATMVAKALGVKATRGGKDTSGVVNVDGAQVAVIVGRDITNSLVRSN